MKVIGNYTEVYRLDEDGNHTFYCWFLNSDDIQQQLAWLLLELQHKSWLPYPNADGRIVDPLKDAEKQVELTGMDPMPRARFEYGGDIYFGYVREYREIESSKTYKHEETKDD